MKKVKDMNGYVIAELNSKERQELNTNYQVFTKDEWKYGEGCRYPEYDDCETLQQAIELVAK